MFYQDLNAIIVNIDPDLSVAEAHGMAAGMLCVNGRTEANFWLHELFQGVEDFHNDDRAVLQDLFEGTKRLLVSDEFTFGLLLPEEDGPLSEQLEALRQWCKGFLYGIGTTAPTQDWSEDGREIVKDIAEFTKLDTDAEGEEAENDFMEITEYLRTSVIFLRTELNSVYNGTVH